MQIAFSLEPADDSFSKQYYIINQIVAEWLKKNQDHQFYIIAYGQIKKEEPASRPGLHFINLPVNSKLPFYRWRCRIQLDSFIKKTGAVILIAFNSSLSRRNNLLQYSFITHPPLQKIKLLRPAKAIIVLSQLLKQRLQKDYPIQEEKISVIYGGTGHVTSLSDEEKILVKEIFSEGKEYFLCFINSIQPENIIQLLKAFSVFKKRQKTNMRLALVGKPDGEEEKFDLLVKTYKYKDDIIVLKDVSKVEQLRLVGSAYAVISIDTHKWDMLSELDVFGAEVPVIANSSSVLNEADKEAALYFDLTDTNDIADKLMLIYKDESLRSKLIQKGNRLIGQYNWALAAESVWQLITK